MTQTHAVLWLNQPLKVRMAYLINYASVFNDAIAIEELRRKIGTCLDLEFESALDQLISEGLVVKGNGFIGLRHLSDKLQKKPSDQAKVGQLLKERTRMLRVLGLFPFIAFVGICGSVAAGNPVENKETKLDIDIFVIAKSQTYWLIKTLLSFYTNFLFKRTKYPYCFNYMMDTSDLEVKNQNMYTATEIYNLIPIKGQKGYQQFLNANRWIVKFYPEFNLPNLPLYKPWTRTSLHHKFFFLVFNVFRCLKSRSLKPIIKISFKDHIENEVNINFKGTHDGGYQLMVLARFKINIQQYFSAYFDERLFHSIFDDAISQSHIMNSFDIHRTIQKKEAIPGWETNFEKYGSTV